jgi:hypothetical protein
MCGVVEASLVASSAPSARLGYAVIETPPSEIGDVEVPVLFPGSTASGSNEYIPLVATAYTCTSALVLTGDVRVNRATFHEIPLVGVVAVATARPLFA